MKISLGPLLQWIFVILMICMTGEIYWAIFAGESYLAYGIVFIFCLMVMVLYGMGIPKWYLIYCIATAACYFISAFMNGIGLSTGLNIKSAFILDVQILVVLVAYKLDKVGLTRRFVDLTVAISFISLLFYTFTSLFGSGAISSLFQYYSWGRGHYVNLLYSFTEDARNYGIFYEPGAYQIVIISSIYFLIYAKDILNYSRKRYNIYLIVLLVTLLTSGSTTGYINLAFIAFGILFQKSKSRAQKRIAVIFLLIIAFLAVDYIFNGNDSLLNTYLLNKIFDMDLSLTEGVSSYNSSGGARLFIMTLALQALKENPFFGIGSVRINEAVASEFYEGFGTGNALCGMIASKGLVSTLITIVPLLQMGYRNRISRMQYFVFIMVYFNTVIAQSTSSLASCAFVMICFFEFDELYAENAIMGGGSIM